ncbi:AraC-like DNA-binding protein [Nocardia sp. GAS34]|uniref:TetR/AcrR family transcriptional regulator n=1 Tax=unclassified Nocardia TaxID=2637762 RepID=UPI003D1C4D4F
MTRYCQGHEPTPVQPGKRTAQIEQSRRQVLDAARALLGEGDSYTGFTLDAVAKRADVARATVYYQFGSKTGPGLRRCADPGHVEPGFARRATGFAADRPVPLSRAAEALG